MIGKLTPINSVAGIALPLSTLEAFLSKVPRRPRSRGRFVSALVLAALLFTCRVFSDCYSVERVVVTVAHTNDLHSQLSSRMDGVEPVGGIARIATLIDRVRASEPYVIVLDAGDIFMGTPFFTFYGGKAEVECLKWMRLTGLVPCLTLRVDPIQTFSLPGHLHSRRLI